MSRNRKLYLSELLTRCANKELAVHIGQPYEMYFESINDCIQYVRDTEYWNYEVKQWLQSKWKSTNTKWIPTLYIKIQ